MDVLVGDALLRLDRVAEVAVDVASAQARLDEVQDAVKAAADFQAIIGAQEALRAAKEELARQQAHEAKAWEKVLATKVAELPAGASFGELALLYNQPRNATVRAATAGRVWTLDRVSFKRFLHFSSARNPGVIDNIPMTTRTKK